MSRVKEMRRRVMKLLNSFTLWQSRYEYEHQKFERFTERTVEYAFLFEQLSKYYPRTVLDVGTGSTAVPSLIRSGGHLVTAIDNIRDYWPDGMFNRHYHVVDDDITESRLEERYDAVTCISVLEHIEDHRSAVRNMLGLLNPGGHLLLSFPYTEKTYVPNVYREPGSSYGSDFPFVTRSYSRRELTGWLESGEGTIVHQDYWCFWTGHCWTVGKQVIPPRKVSADELHQLSCVVIRKAGSS